MKQEINLTVNRLPARTWNRLGMNESRFAVGKTENGNPSLARVTGDGIAAEPFAGEAAENTAWARMATGMGADMDAFLADADRDALLVTAKSGAGEGALAELIYTLPAGKQAKSRLYLHAKKNSVLNVAVLYRSGTACDGGGVPRASGNGLAALQTRIYAEEGAKVRLSMAQTMADEDLCLNDIGAVCEAGASVELVRLELGAGKLYAGGEIGLDGEGSSFDAQIGYAGRPAQRLDMNYTVRHRGKETESLMDVNGVLAENAFKIFRGTIDFLPGCAGAKGTETENVLLLADKVVNQTIPLILCAEEDVEGNHGATIGKLDERTLFYLATRGIPKEEAERLIARARVEALSSRIPSEKIRGEIAAFMGSAEDVREVPDDD